MTETCEHNFQVTNSVVKMRGTYDQNNIQTQERVIIYCQKCGKIVLDSVLNDKGEVFKQ